MEVMQHANPTVSTPLTRRAAPLPKDASLGRVPLRRRQGGVPNPGWPGTATLRLEHPHVLPLERNSKYIIFG